MLLLLLLTSCSSLFAAGPTANVRDGYLLYQYDPVSYFEPGGPKKGMSQITTEVDGVKIAFTSDEHRAQFLKDPKHFLPAYEGWCATAVASGYKYDIDPKAYQITDGRLFLFYKGWKGDAKKDWLKDEVGNLKKAEANWPKVRLTEE